MPRSAMFAALCALVVSLASWSSAFAQIIYEPVRYQWGDQQKYYYGGNDPLVHYFAQMPVGGAGRWGRVHGWAFASGDIDVHREVATERVRVFTDSLPVRYTNAAVLGFTPTDARNEAYANAPCYFRKRDLLASAYRAPDGTLVVPANAPLVQPDYRAASDNYLPPRRATTSPRPIMIIPKDLLKKPADKPSDKSFAATR